MTRVRSFAVNYFFRRTFEYEISASDSSVGAEIDDVIGAFDDVEIVFDDDDGVSGIDESVQNGDQFPNVVWMKTGCGFVEDVKSLSVGDPFKFVGEF